MKFTILCDTKPDNCTSCPFYQPIPVRVANNLIDIQDKCILGANNIQQCPITEVNTIFDTELDAPVESCPTAFCPNCGTQRTYNITVQQEHAKVREIEFDYAAKIATCTKCQRELYIPSLHDENVENRNKTYQLLKGE